MKSKQFFTKEEAEKIIALIREKLISDSSRQKSIRNKIRSLGFYASDYGLRDGYNVDDFLRVAKIIGNHSPLTTTNNIEPKLSVKPIVRTSNNRNTSDECYIIDLCDEILQRSSKRQHRFDFLKGDSGVRLPVDAYYPDLQLVIEFKEKQHTESVKLFDKRNTVSGVDRREQRILYDQRRRDLLPQFGITLKELDYSEFQHTSRKKLVRNRELDANQLKKRLNNII